MTPLVPVWIAIPSRVTRYADRMNLYRPPELLPFRTFHDFLVRYIATAMGAAWGNSEIAKPAEQRHPIVVWYQALCAHQRTFMKEPGKVHDAPWTGGAAAYLHLANDLYALDHNAELQERLLARLRNHEGFTGARYEVYVAAMCL